MPPVDNPRLMNDLDGQQTCDQIANPDETGDNIESPDSCSEKPTNGGGDVPADEADDDSRKLFVGGLSRETTENDLRDYFSRWGKVTQCIIKLDRFTGNSRGFGFVTMESEDCVSKVLCVSEHWLNNKKIDPKKAKPSREPLRKVFVGGIDPDVTEEQIREYFSSFGKVESLDLPFDAQKGRRKHYIFVSFATEAAARKAIALERQEIFGRQCDVRVAVTREQASRQKALKQWYGFFDYAYPGYTFGDFANPYSGYDPYVYGFYGYDYQNTAAAAASYGAYPPNLSSNQFRGTKSNPGQQRGSNVGTGGNNRLMPSAGNPGGPMSNHHTQQTPSHSNLNYNLMNHPVLDHHPSSLSSGGAFDFGAPHIPQATPAGMVASAATGYPHP
ncbi:Heteroproteinous nuclear ribonucleoprotein D0 [Clonorchis sinensis]|uniref:Heteroproteinous nuclear ribonucleoprotein D0 n=1 Tax=Clonorchis sinensis TaxID=79923 RepID=A0A3R7GUP6_CLOSI|nr:Heteroproteinous nuclear ribonucleoprotein D0 [Clonorchis sinensis]